MVWRCENPLLPPPESVWGSVPNGAWYPVSNRYDVYVNGTKVSSHEVHSITDEGGRKANKYVTSTGTPISAAYLTQQIEQGVRQGVSANSGVTTSNINPTNNNTTQGRPTQGGGSAGTRQGGGSGG